MSQRGSAVLEDLFALCRRRRHHREHQRDRSPSPHPGEGQPGHQAFVSGKKEQNAIKSTLFSERRGRALSIGIVRQGRIHDQAAVRTDGIAEQFHQHPDAKAEVDAGYRRLASELPDQVSAPPNNPSDNACAETTLPGANSVAASPPSGSVWNTPAPSNAVALQRAPGAVKPTRHPTWRSPH
ncbi:transposase family protein [Streptomyces sp. NBC_01220]|uniref:transposase family protein n=1 Tax=Streptomyces sp. NBC_01220 TaxID=2903781 RepID=UPI00352EBF41